jgi:hypothetical protein
LPSDLSALGDLGLAEAEELAAPAQLDRDLRLVGTRRRQRRGVGEIGGAVRDTARERRRDIRD